MSLFYLVSNGSRLRKVNSEHTMEQKAAIINGICSSHEICLLLQGRTNNLIVKNANGVSSATLEAAKPAPSPAGLAWASNATARATRRAYIQLFEEKQVLHE